MPAAGNFTREKEKELVFRRAFTERRRYREPEVLIELIDETRGNVFAILAFFAHELTKRWDVLGSQVM